jgi:hypothetical protein
LKVARERIALTGQRNHPHVKRLGNPNGARALRGKQVGNKQAVTTIKAKAQERAENLRAHRRGLAERGCYQRAGHGTGIKCEGDPDASGRTLARLMERLSM